MFVVLGSLPRQRIPIFAAVVPVVVAVVIPSVAFFPTAIAAISVVAPVIDVVDPIDVVVSVPVVVHETGHYTTLFRSLRRKRSEGATSDIEPTGTGSTSTVG